MSTRNRGPLYTLGSGAELPMGHMDENTLGILAEALLEGPHQAADVVRRMERLLYVVLNPGLTLWGNVTGVGGRVIDSGTLVYVGNDVGDDFKHVTIVGGQAGVVYSDHFKEPHVVYLGMHRVTRKHGA
jgi:hypothetical protein